MRVAVDISLYPLDKNFIPPIKDVIERINATGEAWFGPTQWHGMNVMRISVSNFRTTPEDVARTVEVVAQALKD